MGTQKGNVDLTHFRTAALGSDRVGDVPDVQVALRRRARLGRVPTSRVRSVADARKPFAGRLQRYSRFSSFDGSNRIPNTSRDPGGVQSHFCESHFARRVRDQAVSGQIKIGLMAPAERVV